MYELIKQVVRKVVPQNSIQKHHSKFRYALGLLYRGRKFGCNICGLKFRKFIKLNTHDLLCPSCGSLPRTRGLYQLINDRINDKTVLHFSPPFPLKKLIEQRGVAQQYMTSDFEDEFESEFEFNIEDIKLNANSVDLIICYHVLEHVENDVKALRELHRILKDEGECYIQTPFKQGEIYEDPSITDPEARLKHFGQADHLRIYSAKGLANRMTQAGFTSEIHEFDHEENNYFGLKLKDIVVIGRKGRK